MSTVASQEMGRLHDLMCVEALEGGLEPAQVQELARLAARMPEVNTNYYWEALGATELALYGSGLVPPSDARKAWLQDAAKHFGWEYEAYIGAEPEAAEQGQQKVLIESDPLDDTIAVERAPFRFEPEEEGLDKQRLGLVEEDALLADELDDTVLNWDSAPSQIEAYAADRGLTEAGSQTRTEGGVFAWVVVLLAVCLLASGVYYAGQIQVFAESWGLVAERNLQGEEYPIELQASGARIGLVEWDEVRQQGLLKIDAMPVSVDEERQMQVWIVDSGRNGAALPVALLRPNLVAHEVELQSALLVKKFGGLIISSEPLGGALVPGRGGVIARADGR